MNKSESIKELATALSKLQGEIKDVGKNRKGRFEYADLPAFFDVARPLLERNGLAVTQLVSNVGENIAIETILMHSSGEWLSSTISSPIYKGQSGNPLQDIGSVITYLKRYSFSALLCFDKTDDDDDAESHTPPQQQRAAPKPPFAQQPSINPTISSIQIAELGKMLLLAKMDRKKFLEAYKIGDINMLPEKDYGKAMGRLQELADQLANNPTAADYASV